MAEVYLLSKFYDYSFNNHVGQLCIEISGVSPTIGTIVIVNPPSIHINWGMGLQIPIPLLQN